MLVALMSPDESALRWPMVTPAGTVTSGSITTTPPTISG